MKAVGDRYEEVAVKYLVKRGLKIVARNFHSRSGEIDIIASRGEKFYFFEVRYRGSASLQDAAGSISNLKRSRIFSTVGYWLLENGYDEECIGGVYAFLIDRVVGEGEFKASNMPRNIVKIIEIGV